MEYTLPPPKTAFRNTLADLRRLTYEVKHASIDDKSPRRGASPVQVGPSSPSQLPGRARARRFISEHEHSNSTAGFLPRISSRPGASSGSMTERSHRPQRPGAFRRSASARESSNRDASPAEANGRQPPMSIREAGLPRLSKFPRSRAGDDRFLEARSTRVPPPLQRLQALEEYVLRASGNLLGSVSSQLSWRTSDADADYYNLRPSEFYNHFQRNNELTTKVGLARTLARHAAATGETADHFFPSCFDPSRSSDRAAFITNFRRLAALKVVLQHMRLDAERAGGSGALWLPKAGGSSPLSSFVQGYVCNLDMLDAAASALQAWCQEIDPEIEPCISSTEGAHLSESTWAALVCYSELSEEQICGKSAEHLDSQCYPEFKGHQWGNATLQPWNLLENLLRCLEKRWPQKALQGGWRGRNVWVVKAGASGSKRIQPVQCGNSLRDLLLRCDATEHGIIQKYIERPLLLFGYRKFDIRQWVLLRSVSPLRAFMFSECHLRLCNAPYNNFEPGQCVPRKSQDTGLFVARFNSQAPSAQSMEASTAASLAELRGELREITGRGDYWEEELVPQIQKIVLHVLQAASACLVPRENSFELYGFDFAIDEFMHVWLIGVDPSNGCCEGHAPFLDRLLTRMAQRLVEVAVLGREEPDGEWPDWIKICDGEPVNLSEPATRATSQGQRLSGIQSFRQQELQEVGDVRHQRKVIEYSEIEPSRGAPPWERESGQKGEPTTAHNSCSEIPVATSGCDNGLQSACSSSSTAIVSSTTIAAAHLSVGASDSETPSALQNFKRQDGADSSVAHGQKQSSSPRRRRFERADVVEVRPVAAQKNHAEVKAPTPALPECVELPQEVHQVSSKNAANEAQQRDTPPVKAAGPTVALHARVQVQETVDMSGDADDADEADSLGDQPQISALASSTSGLANKVLESKIEALRPRALHQPKRRKTLVVATATDLEAKRKEPKSSPRAGGGSDARAYAKDREDRMLCANLSKKYKLNHNDVWWMMQEFNDFDSNGDHQLDKQEFQNAIRLYINLPGTGPLPKHLLNWHWLSSDKNNDGSLDFEEFLVWTIKTAYTEERLVSDPSERLLRQVARNNGVCISSAEKIKKAFDMYNPDGSGFIELDEFRLVLYEILGIQKESDISNMKMQRWWREVDIEGTGSISFEEFLIWFMTNFKAE